MSSRRNKAAAGAASSIFAVLAAFLALFTVAFAFVVSQPPFSTDVLVSQPS